MTYVTVAIGFVVYYAGLYVWSEWFDKANPRKKDSDSTLQDWLDSISRAFSYFVAALREGGFVLAESYFNMQRSGSVFE
jgi:hypothetical protein